PQRTVELEQALEIPRFALYLANAFEHVHAGQVERPGPAEDVGWRVKRAETPLQADVNARADGDGQVGLIQHASAQTLGLVAGQGNGPVRFPLVLEIHNLEARHWRDGRQKRPDQLVGLRRGHGAYLVERRRHLDAASVKRPDP